jgi:hypothetical protein
MLVVFLLGLIQTMGLVSAALARLSEGTPHERASQRFFLISMALVGMSTLCGFLIGPAYWLTNGTTLSAMILAATCDFSHARRAPAT